MLQYKLNLNELFISIDQHLIVQNINQQGTQWSNQLLDNLLHLQCESLTFESCLSYPEQHHHHSDNEWIERESPCLLHIITTTVNETSVQWLTSQPIVVTEITTVLLLPPNTGVPDVKNEVWQSCSLSFMNNDESNQLQWTDSTGTTLQHDSLPTITSFTTPTIPLTYSPQHTNSISSELLHSLLSVYNQRSVQHLKPVLYGDHAELIENHTTQAETDTNLVLLQEEEHVKTGTTAFHKMMSKAQAKERAETSTILLLFHKLNQAVQMKTSTKIVFELIIRPLLKMMVKQLLKMMRDFCSSSLTEFFHSLITSTLSSFSDPGVEAPMQLPDVEEILNINDMLSGDEVSGAGTEDTEKNDWREDEQGAEGAEGEEGAEQAEGDGSEQMEGEEQQEESFLQHHSRFNRTYIHHPASNTTTFSHHSPESQQILLELGAQTQARFIIGPLNSMLVQQLTDTLTQSVTDHSTNLISKTLNLRLTDKIKEDTNMTTSRAVSRKLIQTLTWKVSSTVVQLLTKELIQSVTHYSAKHLTRTLTRSLSYSLSFSLTRSLIRSPKQDYQCQQCTETQLPERCAECDVTKTTDYYTDYYTSYYTRYFERYYSYYYGEYYSQLFADEQCGVMT